MPQESRSTPTLSPTNRIFQLTEDDLDYLRTAQLEPSTNSDSIRPNIDSRSQELANPGAEGETSVQTGQLVALGMAEEGAVTTAQQAQYDEGLDASFRLLVEQGRSGEPATSSMDVSAPSHGINERISIEDSSTVTPSNRSRQGPQSHDRCTDETRTAEHTSTATDVTDGTSVSSIDGGEEVIGGDHMNNLPPPAEIILLHIHEPPVPPDIVQQAFLFADHTDVPVSDEELLSFERQPLEAQRHTLKVFFKEFVNMGFSDDIAGLGESFA